MQLVIENLTFGWSHDILFDNVSFKSNRDEIIQLAGENGSGKTTLLNLISGMIPHFNRGTTLKGDICLNGHSILKSSPRHFFPAIALIPGINLELFLLTETLSQEILLTRAMSNIDENIAAKHLAEFGKFFPEINDFMKEPVEKLHLAQKILALAYIYYLQNAQLYLFDEVFSAFSNRQVQQFFSFFNWLCSKGCSIIFVDHQYHSDRFPQVLLKDKGLRRL